MEVKKVERWIAPIENGAPLLCMPNVPKPMHHLAPRTIEGQAKWNLMRTKCYMDADYTCQACGKYLGAGKCQAHELYSINWTQQISRFERCVCLCRDCHNFIHSGRTITMYKKGEKGYTKEYLQKIAKHAFRLIKDYNDWRKDALRSDEFYSIYGTLIEWLKDPELGKWIEPMVNKYGIKFYGPFKAYEDIDHWGKWRLEYNGKSYEPKYKTVREWKEAMNVSEM